MCKQINDLSIMCYRAKCLQEQVSALSGTVLDADTVLQDLLDGAEREVSGTGMELIEIYINSSDKDSFCKVFEAFTGVSFAQYIEKCIEAINDTIAAKMNEE